MLLKKSNRQRKAAIYQRKEQKPELKQEHHLTKTQPQTSSKKSKTQTSNLTKWMHIISKVILPHRMAHTLYVLSHHRQNVDFLYSSRRRSTVDFQILFVHSTSPYVWSLILFLIVSKNDIAWCWECWPLFVSPISVIQGRAVQENFGFSAKFWQEQTFEENKAQPPDIYIYQYSDQLFI